VWLFVTAGSSCVNQKS